MFLQFLIKHFSYRTSRLIYCFVIDIVVCFKKIVLFLSLPFKFFQFFWESFNKHSELQTYK